MLDDTIAAVASPPGAALRGVVRVSGPAAFAAVGGLCGLDLAPVRAARPCAVPVLGESAAGFLLTMPGPRSYTGEDVVELHLPGAPVLLDLVLDGLRQRGVRDATPGEFTRRAWSHGRLGLAEAEAVAALIHAAGEGERRFAAGVLRGGLRETVAGLRAALTQALAVLESGLDFVEDETGAVTREQWVPVVEGALRRLATLRAQVPAAVPGGELLLLGAANAGKSSLCNALAGREAVLVDASAGTTRDVVAVPLADGVVVLDAPGDMDAVTAHDRAALALRDRLAQRAGAVLLVIDASAPRAVASLDLAPAGTVFTKADIAPDPGSPMARAAWLAARGLERLPAPHFWVSSHTGAGLDALRAHLRRFRASGPRPGMGRVAAALDECAAAAARAAGAGEDELAAADLAQALRALDAIDGRSTPEDRLDLIFAAFCLGK